MSNFSTELKIAHFFSPKSIDSHEKVSNRNNDISKSLLGCKKVTSSHRGNFTNAQYHVITIKQFIRFELKFWWINHDLECNFEKWRSSFLLSRISIICSMKMIQRALESPDCFECFQYPQYILQRSGKKFKSVWIIFWGVKRGVWAIRSNK